jgi:putative membrane-bound dehydrogenase-like protein
MLAHRPGLQCFACTISIVIGSAAADDREAKPIILQDGISLSLVAEHPDLATPTGIDVDDQGRIWVVATHTHFRPDDYVGPEHDEILIFSDKDGDGKRDRRDVFYAATDATMDLELGADGWVYLAERDRVIRVRDADGDGVGDQEEVVVSLQTEADYPHNGLEGLAWHPNGDLVFGLGENFAKPWVLSGTDGRTLSGTGEGGIFRCAADGTQLRRIAHGLWNPFGICVRVDGEIFATDNDPGERPPCRLLHIVQDGDYGYQRAYGSEAHHPFVAWNGELRGTLPMILPSGEAPCGVSPLGRGLLVPSWSDHRIDFFRLSRKGASYTGERIELLRGTQYFRPGCISSAASDDENVRTWYLTDWVDGSYAAHGYGRLWKLTVDLTSAPWIGETDLEPATDSVRLVNDLQSDEQNLPIAKLMRMSRDDDPFVARAALIALSKQAERWTPQAFIASFPEDRALAVVALKLSGVPADPWIASLLTDRDGDVQFETLRWIADAGLIPFLPEVEAYLKRNDLTFRLFEAAIAARNVLRGRPEAGIRDMDLLLSKVLDDAFSPAMRAFALRLLPLPRITPSNDGGNTSHKLPPELTQEVLNELLTFNDRTLSLEVVRTLSMNPSLGEAILTRIASDPQQVSDIRAEAIAGLSSLAAEHVEMLIGLVEDDAAIREEALRCLRTTELSDQHRALLEMLSTRYPESSDTFAAALHPEDIISNRPAIDHTDAWMAQLNSVSTPPDVENGRRIFHQSSLVRCANCHRHEGRGRVVGPDLSNVGRGKNRRDLLQSILEPSREMAPEYQPRTIELKDGRVVTGIRLRSYTSEVLRDANGQSQTFPTGDVESITESSISFMPAGLANLLTLRELRDLIAFLAR